MQKSLGCLGNLVFGSLFLGAGLALAAVFGKVYAFECRRLEPPSDIGRCTLSSRGIIGSDERRSLPLDSLQGATVEESRDTDGTTYRVKIATADGMLPLSEAYSSGRQKKQNMVDEIRTFIDTKTQVSLSIQQDDRWLGYLIGGVFGGIGVIVILGAPLNLLRGGL